MYWMNRRRIDCTPEGVFDYEATECGYSETRAVFEYDVNGKKTKHHIILKVETKPKYRAICKSKNAICKEAQEWLTRFVGQKLEFIN